MRKRNIYADMEDHLAGRHDPDIENKLRAALAGGTMVIATCKGSSSKREAMRLAEACECRFGICYDMGCVTFKQPPW